MQQHLTEWSLSRRKVFSNCARRFVMQYIKRTEPFKHKGISNKWHSDWDLMIKSVRKVFYDRLTDLHKGVIWSEKITESKMRYELVSNLALHNNKSSSNSIRKFKLIELGLNRIRTLMNSSILRKISNNSIKEWSFYDRVKSVPFGHLDVYCSPDIVYRIKNKWNLVRIVFQAEKRQPQLDLELCSMLLWSRGNQYLPNLEDKFIIHGLSYDSGKWHHKKISPTQNTLQETKQLLEKDVHNMNILQTEFYRTNDIDSMPLAISSLYCKRCPFRTGCLDN